MVAKTINFSTACTRDYGTVRYTLNTLLVNVPCQGRCGNSVKGCEATLDHISGFHHYHLSGWPATKWKRTSKHVHEKRSQRRQLFLFQTTDIGKLNNSRSWNDTSRTTTFVYILLKHFFISCSQQAIHQHEPSFLQSLLQDAFVAKTTTRYLSLCNNTMILWHALRLTCLHCILGHSIQGVSSSKNKLCRKAPCVSTGHIPCWEQFSWSIHIGHSMFARRCLDRFAWWHLQRGYIACFEFKRAKDEIEHQDYIYILLCALPPEKNNIEIQNLEESLTPETASNNPMNELYWKKGRHKS